MGSNQSDQPDESLTMPENQDQTTTPPFGEVETLRTQLAQAEAQSAEYLDGWQRERAEFANFRRRQEQTLKLQQQQAMSKTLLNLISIVDDQDRAFAAIPDEMREHAWVEGLFLVGKKLVAVLEKEGLKEIAARPGDPFDPRYHQAVLHEPSDSFEEGQIAQVFHRGYLLQDQVLRPVIVSVSSGKNPARPEQC